MAESDSKSKKPISSWRTLAIGAGVQVFEVSTLGQPFEVLKTHMAAHRQDSLLTAIKKTWARGGISGFYQGLIPWAWIEASTKGAVLLFTSSKLEHLFKHNLDLSPSVSGILAGMGGGLAQTYTTMGFCTFMKTVEVTRHKSIGTQTPSTWSVAAEILKREGIRGLNRGASAVALRQMTNWGSRMGIARITEQLLRGDRDKSARLSTGERLLASAVGGALGCWNQPIEVIRVEMQSQAKSAGRPTSPTIFNTASYIYREHGLRGFYRGVTPRIGLSVYLTVCMVFGGDELKRRYA
jgi:hypothetical protein